MPSSKLKKNLLVAATGVLLASAVVACGSASADSPATTEVACSDVASQLTDAQTQLTDAQAAAKDAQGTPSETDANNAATSAQAKVDGLNARQTACAQEAPTSATASTTEASTTASSTASSTTAAPCADTWVIGLGVPADANGNWFAGGVPEISSASTDEEAKSATLVWEDKAKFYVGTLVGSAAYTLQKTVDPATLRDSNGCATTAAVALDTEIRLVIANGQPAVDEAPVDATNSGTAEGNVVASTAPGINGDRKATRFTRQDGSYVYVMGRCGNAVAVGTPPVAVSVLAPAPAVIVVVEEAPPVVVTSEAPSSSETTVPYTPPTTVITTTPPAGKQASEQVDGGSSRGEMGGAGSGSYSDRGGQAVTTGDYSAPAAPPASAGQPAGPGAVATTRDSNPPSATASVEQTLHTDNPTAE